LAAVWAGKPTDFNFFHTVAFGWLNGFRRDWLFCLRTRRWLELPHAARIRWRQRRAKLAGFKDGWTAYRQNKTSASANPPTWVESRATARRSVARRRSRARRRRRIENRSRRPSLQRSGALRFSARKQFPQ